MNSWFIKFPHSAKIVSNDHVATPIFNFFFQITAYYDFHKFFKTVAWHRYFIYLAHSLDTDLCARLLLKQTFHLLCHVRGHISNMAKLCQDLGSIRSLQHAPRPRAEPMCVLPAALHPFVCAAHTRASMSRTKGPASTGVCTQTWGCRLVGVRVFLQWKAAVGSKAAELSCCLLPARTPNFGRACLKLAGAAFWRRSKAKLANKKPLVDKRAQ